MKKITLILVAFILAFSSCSKEDDNGNKVIDPLVGTWKSHKYLQNGEEQQLDICSHQDLQIYKEDGTCSLSFFEEVNGNCETVGNNEGVWVYGKWTNDGNNVYSVKWNDEEESITRSYTFENNTFHFEYVNDKGTPDDSSDDIIEKEVYIKQE